MYTLATNFCRSLSQAMFFTLHTGSSFTTSARHAPEVLLGKRENSLSARFIKKLNYEKPLLVKSSQLLQLVINSIFKLFHRFNFYKLLNYFLKNYIVPFYWYLPIIQSGKKIGNILNDWIIYSQTKTRSILPCLSLVQKSTLNDKSMSTLGTYEKRWSNTCRRRHTPIKHHIL